ncbi:hypothetical protein PMAYCL1PPCAC_27195, partial [Pristionchus mayeri]
ISHRIILLLRQHSRVNVLGAAPLFDARSTFENLHHFLTQLLDTTKNIENFLIAFFLRVHVIDTRRTRLEYLTEGTEQSRFRISKFARRGRRYHGTTTLDRLN